MSDPTEAEIAEALKDAQFKTSTILAKAYRNMKAKVAELEKQKVKRHILEGSLVHCDCEEIGRLKAKVFKIHQAHKKAALTLAKGDGKSGVVHEAIAGLLKDIAEALQGDEDKP